MPSLASPEVAAVMKQCAVKDMNDILYRWHFMGQSICFVAWKGMVSQKKALGQAWVAQRRALAKIEAAKNVEVRSTMVHEKAASSEHYGSLMKRTNHKGGMRMMSNVMQKWTHAIMARNIMAWRLNYLVTRSKAAHAEAHASTVLKAVQQSKFDIELQRRQESEEASRKIEELRRGSGCGLMRHVGRRMLNNDKIRALTSMRRNMAQEKGGEHLALLEAQMNAEIESAMGASRKSVGVKVLKEVAKRLNGGLLRLTWGALKATLDDKHKRDLQVSGKRHQMKLEMDMQQKLERFAGRDAEVRSQLEAEVAKRQKLEARVAELEMELAEAHMGMSGMRQSHANHKFTHGLKTMTKVISRMAGGSIRGMVTTWRLKMLVIPPNKRQMVSKYKANVVSDRVLKTSQSGATPEVTPVKVLPSPIGAPNGAARRVATHLKKGWLIGKRADEVDLTGHDLKGMKASGADLTQVNLRDADLSKADLQGAILNGAQLAGAQLVGTNLKGANLEGAFLAGANLKEADLSGARLHGCDMSGATLDFANLTGAFMETNEWISKGWFRRTKVGPVKWDELDLKGAQLGGVNLQGASLRECDLSGADLANANLKGCNMMHVRLDGADLKAANLHEANLQDAMLKGAQMQYARYSLDLMRTGVLKGAILGPVELVGKDCQGVQLDNCSLVGANFQKAFLISASFKGADLTGADLYAANVRGADFGNCTLVNARVKHAVCLNEANLEGANLENSDMHQSKGSSRGGGGAVPAISLPPGR